MHRLCTIVSVFVCLFALSLSAAPKFTFTLDRPEAQYKCGEPATFTVLLAEEDGTPLSQGEMTLTLTRDGRDKISSTKIDLSQQNPATVAGTLETPGFLRLQASYAGGEKPLYAIYGAAYEPLKIQAGAPMPEDFWSFWQQEVQKAEAIPLDLQKEKLDEFSNEQYTSYKVSFAAPGGRVYGFLCLPQGKGRVPAWVSVPGAGPGRDAPAVDANFATLVLNVHPYDPRQPDRSIKELYQELNANGIYMYIGAPDREKVFFHRAILGINRAVNWLAAQPEIDPERLGYYGSSQGGAFGLILGGLNGKFSALVCNVPALCDHLAYKDKRSPGWPGYCSKLKYSPEIEAMVPYYDAVNFARFVKKPIKIMVGFADSTCSPGSVYAAFNAIPTADKEIFNEVGMGHAGRPSFNTSIAWMKKVISAAQP
ncbi:MAG: acetylxylan esterase [Lentisphaerae bacterium]|nr:acetylxylan esterase [Lentisphaerota bacterium]